MVPGTGCADDAERTELLAEVGRQLAPTGQPPRTALGWDDVRELRRRYPQIEIGGSGRRDRNRATYHLGLG